MASTTNRRGFFRFLGLGAVGASVAAVAAPAQAKPAPEQVFIPVCGACPRLVLDQKTGLFREFTCDQCRARGLPKVSGTVAAQSEYPVGSIRWAQQQIVAGHRVRQRCWKDGAGCEDPRGMVEKFGYRYEKGIDSTQGLPIFIELLHGLDWEIVP